MEIWFKVIEKAWKSHGNPLVKMCMNPEESGQTNCWLALLCLLSLLYTYSLCTCAHTHCMNMHKVTYTHTHTQKVTHAHKQDTPTCTFAHTGTCTHVHTDTTQTQSHWRSNMQAERKKSTSYTQKITHWHTHHTTLSAHSLCSHKCTPTHNIQTSTRSLTHSHTPSYTFTEGRQGGRLSRILWVSGFLPPWLTRYFEHKNALYLR